MFSSEETCTDSMNQIQSVEFTDPAYFGVHHLSVPCYLLQHNRYSREGWLATRRLLYDMITLNLSQEEAYRRSTSMMDNRQRQWQFAKGPRLQEVEDITWNKTIADLRTESAAHYCADVRDWARAVLADTAALVQRLDSK